ncbi:MAG: methyltransferase domain-containing protein [Eubacteriales bacterium]|nr:methyltransferase domain-containing protein [Eubacteriales bacterium]
MLLKGKTVKNTDIAASYDKVSKNYERYYLDTMHRHNDRVLNLLINKIREKQDKQSILDLACGTGYNTKYLLSRGIEADYTLVDLSKGMLEVAGERGMDSSVSLVNKDMLSFLKECPGEYFDIVICMWAIKYQPPQKVILECERVLKKNGLMAVIVNTCDTLPQMRRLYPKLVVYNRRSIKKVMFDLPNPKNKKEFAGWFTKAGFCIDELDDGRQIFCFKNAKRLVEFLNSTGALAGYDTMLDLRADTIQRQMVSYFKKNNILIAEHRFVFGVFEKGKSREATCNAVKNDRQQRYTL